MVAGKYGLNLACMCLKIWTGSSLKFLEKHGLEKMLCMLFF